MTPKATLPLIVLFTFTLACTATAGGPEKRRVHEIEAGHEVQPPSFDDMWKESVAVVRGRVVNATVQLSTSPSSANPRPLTKVRLHVDEQYKGKLSLSRSGELTVYQLAGEFSSAELTVRQLGVEPLAPGREYVLFLGWNSHFNRWMVRGSNGVFELSGTRVRPFGDAPVVRQRKTQSVAAFLDELRRRARDSAGRN